MDKLIRGMAAEDQVRFFACSTKELTEVARVNHNSSPVMTAALGRLLAGGLMMGVTLKNDSDLVTLRIAGTGPAKGLLVTADNKGNIKGYPYVSNVDIPLRPDGKLDVGGAIGAGVLSVIKDLGLKEPYCGQTELQTGEIAEDLTYYYAASEQIPSSVGLGVLVNPDGSVLQAGGFIIQLMPFADDSVISRLEANIKNLPSVTKMLNDGLTPLQMVEKVLDGFDVNVTDELEPKFYCNCSKERFTRGLISLGRTEISDIVAKGEPITVNCHFCNSNYTYSIDELKKILAQTR